MIQFTILTSDYNIRTEILDGREQLVVPVVMMVEGVHAGSRGPMLHRAEDLGRFPESWNGIPVTIMHPETEGRFVSANSPAVLERAVGRVFNTHMDGNKLRAEVWLDKQKLLAYSPLALAYITQGRHLEVSVGVYTEENVVSGVYENESYEAIATNHRPDHLALLPGEQGACSWEDGCGIRVNQLVINLKRDANDMKMTEEQIKARKDLIIEGFSVFIVDNADGYRTIIQKVQSKLDAMDSESRIHFLEELYDGHFIYRARSRGEGEEHLFQQNYSTGSDDSINFTGDPIQVRREISYPQVNKRVKITRSNINNPKKKKENKMAVNEKTPCCPEKVDALIANKTTHWTEADREYLLTQEAAVLEKFIPIEVKPLEPEKVNMSGYIKKSDLKSPDDFMKVIPPEMKDQFESGLNLHKNHRAQLVAHIIAQAVDGVWTEDELNTHSTPMLEKLVSQFPEVVDYSVRGPVPATRKVVKEAPMLPMGMGLKKETV